MSDTFLDSASIDGQEAPEVKKRVPKKDDAKFLQDMRDKYERGVSFDQHNIDAGQDDAQFAVGNQWDPNVKLQRENRAAPVLTFNRVMAFIAQIVGNRLVNETEIKVYPDKGGTKEAASIIEGLIRSIFKNSQADFARDEAQKYQVIGGQGVYCLAIKYSGDDVFEQEVRIEAVRDPYSAVFDPMSIEPSGGDAKWGFLTDDIPKAEYKERWPKAAEVDWDGPNRWNQRGYWIQQDTVRIVSYWSMVTEGVKVLGMTVDGLTRDITDWAEEEYATGRPVEQIPPLAQKQDGSYYVREVPNRFARLYICSGNEILEGPFDYPLSSIPIYRVSGWEVNDGDRIQRWGVTRFIKDPQRLYNFWRSVQAEQLVSAPRNKFLTTQAAISGHEEAWRSSPSNPDPLLFYNENETAPTPILPPPVDQALMQAALTSAQDMKDISNIHEASLGMPSNEVSGKAIQQRQMVSDVGSAIYHDRLKMADERCAKNILEIIPHIYDTMRTIVTVGADSKTTLQVINSGQATDNITIGKYGVTVTVGPSTVTKRQQAREEMMAFVNAMPGTAAMVMDIIAESMDWPQSNKFAARFRNALPPGTVPPDEMTPEMQAMQQQQAQVTQMTQQLEQAMATAEIEKKRADAANAEARANLAQAQAYQAIADAMARTKDVDSKAAEREIAATMDIIDQHNNVQHEDRVFDAEREDARKTESVDG